MDNERGQALIELLLLIPILSLLITGSAMLITKTYERTECSRQVFEAVRGRLEERSTIAFHAKGGSLSESAEGVAGKLKCGNHTEFLFLPKIGRRKTGASPSFSWF